MAVCLAPLGCGFWIADCGFLEGGESVACSAEVVRPAKPMLGMGVPRAMRPVSEGRVAGRWSVMKRTVPVALTRERARRRALVGSWVPWEGEKDCNVSRRAVSLCNGWGGGYLTG